MLNYTYNDTWAVVPWLIIISVFVMINITGVLIIINVQFQVKEED